MKSVPRVSILGLLFGAALALPPFAGSADAVSCDPPVAVASSVQGEVKARLVEAAGWTPVKLRDGFCAGAFIRVLERSRADLYLVNETTLRLDQNTELSITEPPAKKESWLKVLLGGGHFMSRTPRRFNVETPFVNAGVEGTEFFVRVDRHRTFLTVFEGRVIASNEHGSVSLSRGQSMEARSGQPPVIVTVVRPRDAVRWALYYPVVLLAGEEEPTDWRGRAAALLSVGRADEARTLLDEALKGAPGNADALALLAAIAVARNEKEEALSLAEKAVAADPKSSAGWISRSYAQRARFDLEGALASTREAVRMGPGNALARAQLSEMLLSFGRLEEALDEAKKAAAENPNISRTQTVLGFAHLAEGKTRESAAAFERAIGLDQADSLPRLGLGLATIRNGNVEAGRREIEVAASLDPNSSLIRSYLGKAYYEEKRGKDSSTQFSLAKELDPNDPTPHFYDAILKQSQNRPVEALHDIEKSIVLNDNRAVYRSRLLLDDDLAARSASLGRVYDDLGFQQLALAEGWKSVNTNPSNYSAHRFLADSYSALPRHEIARVSELLQSQLLQPININPVQPSLAQKNLFILEGAGPSQSSFNEFNPLFLRDRIALQASGVAGENSTLGDEVALSGVKGNLSFSLGQFHYETDGWRENNDLDQDIYTVLAQYSLSPRTSILAEFRSTDIDQGDMTLNFDPNSFLPSFRYQEESWSARGSFRHAFSPGNDLLGSFAYKKMDSDNHNIQVFPDAIFDLKYGEESDGIGGELQHLYRSSMVDVIGGGGYFNVDAEFPSTVSLILPPPIPSPPPESSTSDSDSRHTNLYVYSNIRWPQTVTWTVGASGDFYRDDQLGNIDQFNPKLGVTWNPLPSTTIRAAVLRTLKRGVVNDQTLEPTQVAGFNQFFDDADGTRTWRYGGGVDQRISENLHGGAEYSQRDLDVPFLTINAPNPVPVVARVDWKERLGRAYMFWTPHAWVALSAEYLYELFDRPLEFTAGIQELKTHRIPLGLAFFHPSGIFLRVRETHFNQKGRFQAQFSDPSLPGEPGSDNFWLTDASVGYRLPKRYGIVSVEAKNLFDRSFRYQDTDPVSPVLQPERTILVRFTLAL